MKEILNGEIKLSEDDEMSLFKGRCIEQIVKIEYYIESIIIEYFIYSLPVSFENKNEEIRLDRKNKSIANYLSHSLFPDAFFGFKQKFECMKIMMQQNHVDLYVKASGGSFNMMQLIKRLSVFRNLLAHNTTFNIHEESVVLQPRNKFSKSKMPNKINKNESIITHSFNAIVKQITINKKTKKEILNQLRTTISFLITYSDFLLTENGNPGHPILDTYISNLIELTKDDCVTRKVGVYTLNK